MSLGGADRTDSSELNSKDAVTGLSIRDLVVQFPGQAPVLLDFSLDVLPGQIIALVGASGCGKSTLLRTIAGLQSHSCGAIEFTGAPNSRRGDLSFVFQDATLLPWRTAYENVRLPLELQPRGDRRMSDQQQEQQIADALDCVELAPASRHLFPRQLSGGMRMRTSIARALVTDPCLLLLDEPFAALDDLLRTKLNQLVLDLWQRRRRTIMLVTHNIAEAALLSHRVVVLGQQRASRLIDNPLPWPRSSQQRTSLEFARLYGLISQALTEASG
ncbi:MAG TPA: hypothetical protein DCF63_11200 [Planctomycetaceae bacterium]|nr:hypothetical protein [Planctomycetaceae bacterium]